MQPKWESATDPQQILYIYKQLKMDSLRQVDNEPLIPLEMTTPKQLKN